MPNNNAGQAAADIFSTYLHITAEYEDTISLIRYITVQGPWQIYYEWDLPHTQDVRGLVFELYMNLNFKNVP